MNADDLTAEAATDPADDILMDRLRQATLGEYDVFGVLGKGGMATVYLAHDLSLDRKVAIKVMAPELIHGADMVERFKREARTAANLSHANIIPIYAVRESHGLNFCVQKLIKGTPLDDIIRELEVLPISMAQAILAQVGEALDYAHRQGVIHRDIKPANILIDDEGWAIVTDFGIAKVQHSDSLTMTGMAVGTPTYMSPEQCNGSLITGASDQYALGIVAFEMIAGRPPFSGESMMAILNSHFNEIPPALHELRPDCPLEISEAVARMLMKKPEDRWGSLQEAAKAMGAVPLEHDDPVRTHLMTLARTGTAHRVVSQVQTPRSPIPLGKAKTGHTIPTTPVTGTTVAAGAQGTNAALVVEKKNLPALIGGVVAAVLIVGYFMAKWIAPSADTVAGSGASPSSDASPVVSVGAAPDKSVNRGATNEPATNQNSANTSETPVRLTPSEPTAPAVSSGTPSAAASRGSGGGGGVGQDNVKPRAGRENGPANAEKVPVVAPPKVNAGVVSGAGVNAAGSSSGAVTGAGSNTGSAPPGSPPVTPPVTTPPVTAPVVADARPEVAAAIMAFTRALAASDLVAARRIYPTMPADQRDGLEALWKDGGKMTPRWNVSDVVVDGTVATARVQGENVVTPKRGQASKVPVSLMARLERRGADWRLVSLTNQ